MSTIATEAHPSGNSTPLASDAPVVEVEGERVTLPVEVRSAKMVAATFLVDAEAAQRVIEVSGLQVARKQRGTKAVCSLSAVHYTDNDLGPYNEFAVGFMVETKGPGPFPRGAQHTYIHHLPVNQTFTCAAGRSIWGFPKWVTEITFRDRPGTTTGTVVEDGLLAVRLTVAHSPLPMPSKPMEMVAYSYCDGVLRSTPWTTRNQALRGRLGGATVELGEGTMADELRSLGLPKKALLTLRTPRMAATFGLPTEI